MWSVIQDIREDSDRGRQYLPVEDLVRFGVSEDELKAGLTPPFFELMRFEADRAAAMTTSQLRFSSLYTPQQALTLGPNHNLLSPSRSHSKVRLQRPLRPYFPVSI
jgi:phytoene synthase